MIVMGSVAAWFDAVFVGWAAAGVLHGHVPQASRPAQATPRHAALPVRSSGERLRADCRSLEGACPRSAQRQRCMAKVTGRSLMGRVT